MTGPRRALAYAAAALALAACRDGRTGEYPVATSGDAHNGREVAGAMGCGSCHTIPGVRGAHGVVGPPLVAFGRRTYIAGELPNTPENLVRWIRDPKAVEPRTAMPTLGLSEQQARDVAAYLYTLR
jgi:cytochrome c1